MHYEDWPSSWWLFSILGGEFFINQFTPCGGIGVALFLILSCYGLNESWKKEWIDGISRKACLGIALPSLAVGIVALGIKQLPLLREMEGTCLWNTTQLLIILPVALGILFGTMTIHERMTNCMVPAWLGLMSYELYLVHMNYLGMVNTTVDIISFMAVSLGMAYSFYHLNTYIGLVWKKKIFRLFLTL